jgi:hypothetical protein
MPALKQWQPQFILEAPQWRLIVKVAMPSDRAARPKFPAAADPTRY